MKNSALFPWLTLSQILITPFLLLSTESWAQSFNNSFAIVVGVDDYSSLGLPGLDNAENDARAIGTYLRSQGYRVTSLIGPEEATKFMVDTAVRQVADQITAEDRFLFFFAGHGIAKRKEGVDVAYLVVPGGTTSSDPNSLISSGDIARHSMALEKARHQVFIFDSCYAGLIGNFQTRSVKSEKANYDSEMYMLRDLGRRRVRQYLAAGGEDQEVLDGGPSNLSWFAYFLLKALEPGVVNDRTNGFITFSELASYVQALSANPYHTPAFGSLAGHRGGEYLFQSTAEGSPELPRLPDISPATLRDMGFLTQNNSPEEISTQIDKMRKPIDLLFQAWLDQDLDLYLQQFDSTIVQTGRFKSGNTFRRSFTDLEMSRRRTFSKLNKVEVLKYEVMYQGFKDGQATFGVRYSMDFHWRNGDTTSERNINECYQVRTHLVEDRWVIIRNDDYQYRICGNN